MQGTWCFLWCNPADPSCVGEDVSVRTKDISDLCFAAAQGDVKGVKRILDSKIGVNVVDYDRRSALHIAAADGQLDVVNLLLSARADPGQRDRWGHTPLDDASRGGYKEIRQALLAVAANTDDGDGASTEGPPSSIAKNEAEVHALQAATNLCCAAAAGSIALVGDLYRGGADLNAGDYDGRRALHLACAHGHTELVNWLIGQQADVNVQDNFGLTPLREAMKQKHNDIAKILCEGGASKPKDTWDVKHQAESGAWAIPLSEVKIDSVLSKTLKSVIYRAEWRGTQVVAKTTPKLKLSRSGNCLDLTDRIPSKGSKVPSVPGAPTMESEAEGAEEELLHEIKLLSTLRHPDLVMFLGACIDAQPPLFLNEFMEGGDLERYYQAQAKKAGQYYRPPTPLLLKWSSSVARALAFLHNCSRPIIHRDLKPLNLLLNRSNDVKVTDFGISKLLAPKTPGCKQNSDDAPVFMSGGVGTWRYMAPEVVRYEQYTDRVDIYSYSLILWFMCTGRQPFVDEFGKDAEVVLKEYLKGKEPRPDLNTMKCPKGLKELTKDCWDASPAKRPSAHDCTQRIAALLV